MKVFLIYTGQNKEHTASNNRFWGLYKMISYNYDCEVMYVNPLRGGLGNIKIFRGLHLRGQIINITIRLFRRRKENHFNFLYLFGVDPVMSLFYKLFSVFSGFKLLSERNELPNCVIHSSKTKEKIYKLFVYPWYFKIFHGYSFITNEIYSYYKPFLLKSQVCKILPMTVDFARFDQCNEGVNDDYVFYAGSLNNKKDGIEYLIRAFPEFNNRYPTVKLLIAGNSSIQDLRHVRDIIGTYKTENIVLLGQINRSEIPKFVKNALLCVLPRPDSPQARGGFPTKLGEYLAAAKPIIITDIGEIPNYLSENEVYFISKNNIEEELSGKIIEVLNNYEKAIAKGHLGYLKAKEYFSLESNSLIIRDFIGTIAKTSK